MQLMVVRKVNEIFISVPIFVQIGDMVLHLKAEDYIGMHDCPTRSPSPTTYRNEA